MQKITSLPEDFETKQLSLFYPVKRRHLTIIEYVYFYIFKTNITAMVKRLF